MENFSERRLYARRDVLNAVMIRPNGDEHDAQVLDVSPGGARLRLPDDWAPRDGALLHMYFSFDPDAAIALQGRVTRVAVDHMGVAFTPDQDARIRDLLAVIDAHH